MTIPAAKGETRQAHASSGTTDTPSQSEPTAPESAATGGETTPSTTPVTMRARPRDGRRVRFVGEIVCAPGERVNRRDMRPHGGGQETRCDGEVLVVFRREAFAVGVGRSGAIC